MVIELQNLTDTYNVNTRVVVLARSIHIQYYPPKHENLNTRVSVYNQTIHNSRVILIREMCRAQTQFSHSSSKEGELIKTRQYLTQVTPGCLMQLSFTEYN